MAQHKLISKPSSAIKGIITVPGDKSISHRAIIFGALANGVTIINGFLDGDDCIATLNAFRAMGVNIEGPENQKVIIHGVGKNGLKKPNQIIDCGNSGTSMRLLAGLLSAQVFDSQLTGDESLLKRPMLRISKPLTQMGANISTIAGKPPIIIQGGQRLTGINYTIPETSAQVKSCILLAGLYAEGPTCITETGISRNHTELMLERFAYPIHYSGAAIIINSQGECQATELFIPGDISSAAFFIVAATIIPGSDIIIQNVGVNATRTGIIHILLEMGADIVFLNQRQEGGEQIADLRIRHCPLVGVTIDPNLVPLAIDEFPVILIAAACAQGKTILRGAEELRFKESDRISAMVIGLKNLGINALAFEDGALIEGGILQGGTVDSFGDHRIAMAFAIAGTVAREPVIISDCKNVTTSFPLFVKTAKKLELEIEELIDNV